jgi:hypothetical protein
MKEFDQLMTSFITSQGRYCYMTMPFGLHNTGAMYQCCMNHVFSDHIGSTVEAYVDDIVVKTRKVDNLIADLEIAFVASELRVSNSTLKMRLWGPRGMLLGFIVSKRGIEANPEKVSTIIGMGPIKMSSEFNGSWDVLWP